jgi:hypothetical protein
LRSVVAATACIFVAFLAGCTYSADVRNTTGGTVLVRLVQVDAIQPDWVLAQERIAPGQYATLGPCRVPFQRVEVEVGNQMKNSVAARYAIKPGTTKLDIGQAPSPDPAREQTVFTLDRRTE